MGTDDMSDAARIDAVYVLYVYLIWETNKMGSTKRGSEAVGGLQTCPASLHDDDGNWRSVIVEEGRAIGVPEEVFEDDGVRRAYLVLTNATRNKRTLLLQAHCSTNQSAFPAPPAALCSPAASACPAGEGIQPLQGSAHGDRRVPCERGDQKRQSDR